MLLKIVKWTNFLDNNTNIAIIKKKSGLPLLVQIIRSIACRLLLINGKNAVNTDVAKNLLLPIVLL